MNDPAVAASLLARGGKVIADYGGFQLIELDTPTLMTLAKGVELEDESDVIELNTARLNTRDVMVKAQRKAVSAFIGKRLHLVQFAGPVKPEWIDELEKSGARIVSYIPNNAYLVYGDAPCFAKMQNWAVTNALVQWEGDYADNYKINPRARLTNELGQAQMPATDLFAIQLVADDAANTNTLALIDQLKLAPIQNQFRALDYLNIIVRLPTARLGEIAARPEVVSIQPYLERRKFCERQAQIMAGNLSGNVPNGPGYLAWLAGKGFTQAQFDASGFVVDVSDSGIDDGTTTPNHFGLFKTGNLASTSRVAYARLEGSANSGSTLQGCDGHGNLNGHIIAGYDDQAGFPFADASGYHYGLGICPFVKVGSSVIFDPATFTSPNYANLQSRAYRDGARVSNNSWGADTAGDYDVDAQTYDALVRDAQPAGSEVPNSGNQGMVIVFAAGNAGPDAATVGSPGTAKNVISVGAAENVQAFGGSDASGVSDSGADNANDIIYFSSRGPCSDGRIKPDICAPGTHISGGVAQSASPV
ncbi:MAG: S8 family serine peptidase [Limisphaerales bacterium]